MYKGEICYGDMDWNKEDGENFGPISVTEESTGMKVIMDVPEEDIILLEYPCFICGKIVNILKNHFTITGNSEQVKTDDEGELQTVVKESESLAHFCSKDCFDKFHIDSFKQTEK